MLKSLCPVLPVDAVEPCLAFWDALGVTVQATVPHGEHLGFAMLSTEDVTIMYQSRASIAEDLGEGGAGLGVQLLYVMVEDLDAVRAKLGDVELAIAQRETFYGTRELGVREPGGHLVVFAQRLGET